ncbi:T9SS type B sorting domain-containing protein [Aquimarina sp. AU474]|uniref:T9SS type B sorting domain-containing protein n=1 Tax=Aquimarina sp. AU474 TaxID=2108529 RepID=UPI00135C9E10|nr:T9SS type B sorting domain-containing protein [Aquimarina sp. AU474]
MKTKIHIKMVLAMLLFFASNISNIYAQEIVPLAPRETRNRVNGNLIMNGNAIVGLVDSFEDNVAYDPDAAYNGNFSNGNSISDYIDIDGDPSTFSSSSADIVTPRPDCTEILYAGLYWSATYYLERIPINRPTLTVNNTPIAGGYGIANNGFFAGSVPIPPSPGITANLVVAIDSGGFTDGCGAPLQNAAAINGNIAVIRRGFCGFTQKVINAQNAGAVAVIIVNNNNGLFAMGGGDAAITIPAVMINLADGNTLINQLATSSVNATLESSVDTTTGDELLTGLPLADARKVGDADFRNVKFRVPGGTYVDVTAQNIIYDGYRNTPTNPSNDATDDVPYVCYADVTALIDQDNTNGTYTLADMNATIGQTSGASGASGGWVLVVIYEDPLESSKFISTNDGFVEIQNSEPDVDFTYTGFTSLPAPLPVEVRYGVAALEGDRGLGATTTRPNGDQLLIENTATPAVFVPLGENNFTPAQNTDINPTINFFNSSITFNHQYVTGRNPASQNTLGFDIDLFDLDNTGNQLVGNDVTDATFRLSTDQDTYRVFLNTFTIDIIEPELRIIKRVFDLDGVTEITNGNVELGDELFYDLEIENVGNEDMLDDPAFPVTIRDILPANVNFLSVQTATLPPGVTFDTSTPGIIDFDIPPSLVEETDGPIFIRFRVALVNSCENLRDACSDRIQNSALATFTGDISRETRTNNSSSIIGACGNTDGEATNFLVNIPACSSDVTFCNNTLRLEAGTGYDRYTWSGPGIAPPIVQTGPNANIFEPTNPQSGTYSVIKEDTDPSDGTCITLTEDFVVDDFRSIRNPILDYVNGTSVITTDCSGLELPQILLCGDQTLLLETNFNPTNLQSISWQRLVPDGTDPATDCVSDSNDPCSLLSGNCSDTNWVEEPAGNVSSFTVSTAGDYRILAEFEGGCFIPFYFSVFKNDYQPTLAMDPIECGFAGSVSVTNAPTNFEFSLTSGGPYSNTTVFPIAPGGGGDITVYGIDTTFPGCEYTATINVPEINPTFTVTGTNPTCTNDDNGTGTGSIQILVTGGLPQYQYTISGGTLTSPIIVPNSSANNGNYTQDNLNPGVYTVEVISNRPDPECIDTQTITIDPAPDFTAEAVLLAPATCDAGALVQINVTAGSGTYEYDDGSGTFQTNNVFEIPRPANPATVYTFFVADASLPAGTPACIIEVDITGITPYEPIVLDNVTVTQPPCPGDGAQVRVEVSPVVAGREYTYQLLDTRDTDPNPVYPVIDQIVTTARDITFVGVADLTSYRVRVFHNNTTDPTGAPICPVDGTDFAITSPVPVDATVTTTRELSCQAAPNDTAIITIAGLSGGSGTYEWSFNASSGYANITSDPFLIPVSVAGNYTVYIRNQGTGTCAVSFPAVVAPLEPVTDIDFTLGTSDCTAQTVQVTAVAVPAGPTYTYTVTPAPVSSGPGLGEFVVDRGTTYTFTATRGDNQCFFSEDFREDLLPEVQVTAVETDPVSCVGFADGEFSFTVTNSTSFTYTVTGPTAVPAGGGTDATPILSGPVLAGTYTINVTDTTIPAGGCVASTTVDVTEPATPLTLTAVSEPADCGADTGTITATAGGGRGNYQFELRDNTNTVVTGFGYPNTSNVFNGLAAGDYTVLARDGNSSDACEVTFAITVGQFAPPTIAIGTGGDPCVDVDSATQWVTITPNPTTTAVGPFEYDLTGPVTANDVPVTFLSTTPPVSAPANTFEIPNLIAGAYTVIVTNTATSCVSAVAAFTINPELTITATLTQDIDCNNPEPTITFAAADGSGVYTQFDLYTPGSPPVAVAGGGNITSPFTNAILVPGDYVVGVVDNAGCTAFSNTVTVTPFDAVTATLTPNDPTCNGLTDGSIDVEVTAGEGPFTYVLDGDLTTQIGPTGDTTVTFNNVDTTPSPHTVTITDGSGATPVCTFDFTTTLNDPIAITATINPIRDLSCVAPMDARVEVTLAGGSGSYEWSTDGTTFTPAGTTLFTIDFSIAGPYTLSVRNAATDDCLTTFPITIDPLTEVTDLTFAGTPVVCTGPDPITSDVTVTPVITGGGTVVDFEITAPAPVGPQPTGVFNNLAPGTYTFLVRTDDGCTYSEDFVIEDIDRIAVTATPVNQPTCNGDTDGELSFTVSGIDIPATATYEYEITGGTPVIVPITATGQTAATITTGDVLPAGSYTITVTDEATGCEDTATITINQPDALTITGTPVVALTCVADATVTINTTGGNGGNEYTLTLGATVLGPQTSNVFSVGTAGTYTVDVEDDLGCTATTTVDVVDPPTVTASVTGGDPCYDITDAASVDISIAGGLAPFTYTVDAGAPVNVVGTTFTVNGLTPDTYNIVIRDANGCTDTVVHTIQPELIVTASLTKDLDCVSDATITFSATGGDGSYTFDILDVGTGLVFTAGATSPAPINTAGTYQVRVTDTSTPNCTDLSPEIDVTNPDPVTANTNVTDVLCFGDATGAVEVVPTGGAGPFEVRLLPAGVFGTNFTFTGLTGAAAPGTTYSFEIRDSKGCTTTVSADVEENAQIDATVNTITDIDCSTNITGTIVLNPATGGAASITDYTYVLLNNDLTQNTRTTTNPQVLAPGVGPTFDNLDAGSYFVDIIGSDGCSNRVGPFAVAQPPFDLDFDVTPAPADCATGARYQIEVSGGEGPFLINEFRSTNIADFEPLNGNLNGVLTPLPNAFGNETRHEFTGLDFGVPYVFEIIDTNSGCRYFEAVPVVDPPGFDVTVDATIPASCFGDTDGRVTFTVTTTSGATTVDWEIFDADTGVSTGFSGTEATPVTTLTVPAAPGPGLSEGNYFIRVEETAGAATPCEDGAPFTITQPSSPLTLNFISATDTHCNALLSTVTMDANGGVPGYSFAAVPGPGGADPGVYPLTNVFTLDPATSLAWTIFVQDSNTGGNNCVSMREITIPARIADPVITNVSATVDPCVFDNAYEFTVTATGQSQLQFGIDDGDTGTADSFAFVDGTPTVNPNEYEFTFIVSSPSVDNYTITVRDQNGCTDDDTKIIFPELLATASFTAVPDCLVDDGEITIVPTGGSDFTANPANFTFTLNGTDSGGTPVGPIVQSGAGGDVFTGIAAGTYTITVLDSNVGPLTGSGCTTTANAFIDVPLEPVLVPATTFVSCIGNTDGVITAALTPASTDADPNVSYQYQITAPLASATPLQSSPIFTGLGIGAYTVNVVATYSNGALDVVCSDPETYTISNPTLASVTISNTDYGCTGATVNLPVITLSGFTGGTGSTYTITYTVDGTPVVTTPVDPTTLDTDPAAGIQIIANIPGDYVFTVYDSNNCPSPQAVRTIPPFPILTNPTVVRDTSGGLATNFGEISCDTPELVIVSVDRILGNVAGYQFDLLPVGGAEVQTVAEDASGTTSSGPFTLATPGTYVFRITDLDTGCSIDTAPYVIAPFDLIDANVAVATQVTCNGASTGELNLNVLNYTGEFNYTVRNTTTSAVVGTNTVLAGFTNPVLIGLLPTPPQTPIGLPAGTYVVEIEAVDAPFCDTVTETVTITQPDPLTLAIDDNINANCNEDARVIVSVTGGTGPYTFRADDDGIAPFLFETTTTNTTNTFLLPATVAGTTYIISVIDDNSCTSTPVSISEDVFRTDTPTVDSVTWTDPCVFDDNYTIRVVGTSNVPVVAPATNALTFEIGPAGSGDVAGNVNGTTHDFTVTTPGTYTVRVYDENGCVSVDETITIVPELTISATFTGTPECRTDVNGVITATVNGGSDFTVTPGNFTFTLTGTDSAGLPIVPVVQVGAGGNVFNNVTAGLYNVSVTDSNVLPATGSGCSQNVNVSLPIPLIPDITAVGEAVSCIGDSDGRVVVTLVPATDDGGSYTYQLFQDAGGGTPGAQVGTDQTDDPVFTNVPVGNYVAVIESSSVCTDQTTVSVPNATQVTGAVTDVGPYTCTGGTTENFPVVTVTIDNGTPPYNLTYTTPAGVPVTVLSITDEDAVTAGVQYTFTADESGTYVFAVTDNKGCETNPVTFNEVITLPVMTDPTATQDVAITCPAGEEVTVSVTGGTGPFTFDVISSPVAVPSQINVPAGTADNPGTPAVETNATNVSFVLPAVGVYVFSITDQTTMCSVEVSYTIDQFDLVEIVAAQQTPETCFGDADGSVEIMVSQYVGAFSYTIVDVGVTPEAIVFTSTVDLVTDVDPATADTFVIPPPPGGLSVGNYRVDILETGTPNCPGSSNVFTIEGPSVPFEVTLFAINDQETCSPANDISFQATVGGARGTVTYTLVETGTNNTTGLFTGLSIAQATNTAGVFTFTVTAVDDNGTFTCTDDDTITVTPPADDVAITPIPDSSITCFEDQDGRIEVFATATDVPLRYSITPNGGTESVLQTVNVFDNLLPNTYTITVYDQLGCTAQTTAVINDVPEVEVAIDNIVPVTCSVNTVTVTLSATNAVGVPQFVQINVTDSSNPIELAPTTSNTFILTEGQYVFYVIDANGCRSRQSDPVPVIPINPITFNLDTSAAMINCRDEATAIIDITDLTGGIGDYEFVLLDRSTTPASIVGGPQSTTEFRDLAPGLYTYVARSVSDNSCIDSQDFEITNPPLFDPTFDFTNVTCNGENDGTITIFAAGGTPPYSFAIDSMAGTFFNDASDGVPNQHTFEDLEPNTYVVLAQDANGCDVLFTQIIIEPNTLEAAETDNMAETCFGANDGAFTIEITGGTPPYETNITNNDADFVVDMFTYTGLPGGVTEVFIRDANGCRISRQITIEPGVVLDADLMPRLECPVRDPDNPANIFTGPRYFIDFELTPNSVMTDIIFTLTGINGTADPASNTNLTGEFEVNPGEYLGTMEHAGGCIVDVGTIIIEEYIPLSVPVAQMTNNPQDPNEYEIIVTGGVPPYTYFVTFEGVEVELEDNIFAIRETGDYIIRVLDSSGCDVTSTQFLTYINIRIPNYFTPDDPNSTPDEQFWYPRQITPNANDPFFFENMEVTIFDRYGRMLAEYKGDQQGWKGTYQGKELPSGDYWYTIILNDIDNREFTGHFTLYR